MRRGTGAGEVGCQLLLQEGPGGRPARGRKFSCPGTQYEEMEAIRLRGSEGDTDEFGPATRLPPRPGRRVSRLATEARYGIGGSYEGTPIGHDAGPRLHPER